MFNWLVNWAKNGGEYVEEPRRTIFLMLSRDEAEEILSLLRLEYTRMVMRGRYLKRAILFRILIEKIKDELKSEVGE